jgi:hypothetical protein
MQKILRIVLSLTTITLAIYGLITSNFEFMPYMMLSLGALMLFIGIVEIRRQRKAYWGYISIIVSLFVVYVAIQGFLLH